MRRLLPFAVILVFTLSVMPEAAWPSDWLEQETANMHAITGPFVQRDYGFRVEAPPGIAAYVSKGGDADHGVLMILGEDREIAVYPEYIFPDLGNGKPCRVDRFSAGPVSEETREGIALGERNACLITISDDGAIWKVAQIKGDDRGQGIMYTLLLKTTRSSLATDMLAFQRVATSFRFISIVP